MCVPWQRKSAISAMSTNNTASRPDWELKETYTEGNEANEEEGRGQTFHLPKAASEAPQGLDTSNLDKKNWLPWVTMGYHSLPQVTMSGREIEQPGAAAAPVRRKE